MVNKRICVIGNIGAHYRLPIYKAMNKEFACDFYFGNHIQTPIKTIEISSLTGYRATLKNIFFYKFYWQRKSIGLLNKPYEYYILDGEPYCISSWVILLLSKLKKKKTIAWTHGWYGRESFIKRIIKKIFYSQYSFLMLYNNYAINLMEKQGFNRKKMFCIANSMDSDKEKYLREKQVKTDIYSSHFHNGNPVIIYCGRIQIVKKLDLLLNAVKNLKDNGILVNIIFVGKDVDNVNIDNQAKNLGIEQQIWMYGPCYDDDIIAELFYNANVCVSPGNVGLTAIHSLTFGCPVITHGNLPDQMPEFEAIRPGITGDFFKENDAYDLSEKIKKWISLNDAQRDETRNAAYKEIDQKWNIHYQINTIRKIINEIN
jgi:glycosyltransferase involved in cell wall biosynthesis